MSNVHDELKKWTQRHYVGERLTEVMCLIRDKDEVLHPEYLVEAKLPKELVPSLVQRIDFTGKKNRSICLDGVDSDKVFGVPAIALLSHLRVLLDVNPSTAKDDTKKFESDLERTKKALKEFCDAEDAAWARQQAAEKAKKEAEAAAEAESAIDEAADAASAALEEAAAGDKEDAAAGGDAAAAS